MLRTRQSLDKFFWIYEKWRSSPSAEIRSLIIKSYELLNGRFVCGPQCLRRTSRIKQNRKKKRYTNQNKWYLLGLFLSVEESLHRGLFHWLTSLHAVYKSYPSSFQSNYCLNKTSFLGQHSCNSWSPWLNFKCKSNSVPLFFYDPLFPGIAIASLITLQISVTQQHLQEKYCYYTSIGKWDKLQIISIKVLSAQCG